MNLLIEIAAFIVSIGVLVVVHEFGHFSVARLCGVKVLRFSIGFGRPLLRHISKKTGTEWTIAMLPLGGYVKMLDERDPGAGIADEDLPFAFNRQSVGKRIAIVLAGPVANFLLAILLFAAIFATGITEFKAIVAPPPADTIAAKAGFKGGETVLKISGEQGTQAEAVRSWSDLRWKLLGAALDQRSVMLHAENERGAVDFQLDLHNVSNRDVDDNFMSKLGLEPGGGALTVATVESDSAAQRAGLSPGDILHAIDGKPIDSAAAFIAYVQSHPQRSLQLQFERDGAAGGSARAPTLRTVTIVPDAQRDVAANTTVGRIGVALSLQMPSIKVRYGLSESIRLGALRTWDVSLYSLRMFGRMLIGQASLKNLSGPVTIADYAGKSVRLGLASFLSFLALVSISLGVLNLLPIPLLDGGHLLYYSVEAATGRAVPERWQLVLQRVGLICIVALSAIALFNDLTRLIHFN